MNVQKDKLKGPLMHEHRNYVKVPIKDFGFGALYNWFVVDDTRQITANNWRVATNEDYIALLFFADPSAIDNYTNQAGIVLKQLGVANWNNATGTDTLGFAAKGSGMRNENGLFISRKASALFWSDGPYSQLTEGYRNVCQLFSSLNNLHGSWDFDHTQFSMPKKIGASIRLVKNSTTLTNGKTGSYNGNDGKVYPTICIGGQEWTKENLSETKYRDGSLIPNVPDYTAWVITFDRCNVLLRQ